MDLVADESPSAATQNPSGEVYEDESGPQGMVTIDPVTMQNIGVKTALVERRALSRTVRALGRVDYDETGMSDVNTKVAGWVEKLLVDYTGQAVKKGQPLLELYSPELVAAQEEYLTALDYKKRLKKNAPGQEMTAVQDLTGVQDLLEAAAQRLRYWDITDDQIATLERSRQIKRTLTIFSPRQGVVIHKAVFAGAHINAGQHLYRIADLSTVWVYADIYEYELPWIKQGQNARVELTYLPGQIFHGQITYIYPFLEAKTRTAKVRIQFSNPDGAFKPQMYAKVELQAPVSQETLVVPTQALIRSGARTIAVVSLGEGKFQPREVELGSEADSYSQVLSGLQEGMRIVTSAQFLIDSESNLKAAVQNMSSASPEESASGKEAMEMPPIKAADAEHQAKAATDRAKPETAATASDHSAAVQGEPMDHKTHAEHEMEAHADTVHKHH
jgi:Cu(I)/Ag(I) efflux system membrane fusion protein/cobalt-zinc-cadmium efflux system membrane fusion protein